MEKAEPRLETSCLKSLPKLINQRYQLGDKIGSGSFGEIYAGCDIEDKKLVAIKIEPLSARNPQLIYESQIYSYIGGFEGIPKLYWYGTESGYNIMIIDFLGPSLEDILNKHKSLPLNFVLDLAQQMITRIEFLHEKLLLHRDIKPENFLLGTGSNFKILYLIDFGLVKKYRDSSGRHIPYRESKGMTGTARYASICTHLGIEQARRDDLEGIAYVLIYLMKGQLPWQGLKASVKVDKYGKILRKKLNVTIKALCQDLPSCFNYLLSYCRVLRFQDRPDYNLIKKYFSDEWKQNQLKASKLLSNTPQKASPSTNYKLINCKNYSQHPLVDERVKNQYRNKRGKRKLPYPIITTPSISHYPFISTNLNYLPNHIKISNDIHLINNISQLHENVTQLEYNDREFTSKDVSNVIQCHFKSNKENFFYHS